MFGIDLDNIDEKDAIIVANAKSGTKHKTYFCDLGETDITLLWCDEKGDKVEQSWEDKGFKAKSFSFGFGYKIASDWIGKAIRET